MLERTAVSLEQCNLKRVLPPAKATNFITSRRLHADFWKHGAARIELSSIWHSLLRQPTEPLYVSPVSKLSRGEPLNASNLLFDVQHPLVALGLIRGLPPWVLEKYENPGRLQFRAIAPRLFTSLAPVLKQPLTEAEKPMSEHIDKDESRWDACNDANELRRQNEDDFDLDQRFDQEQRHGKGLEDIPQQHDTAENPSAVELRTQDPASMSFEVIEKFLQELLDTGAGEDFGKIWQLYQLLGSLNSKNRELLRERFVDYIMAHVKDTSQLLARAQQLDDVRIIWAIWKRIPSNQRSEQYRQIDKLIPLDDLMLGICRITRLIEAYKKSQDTDMAKLSASLLEQFVYPCIRRFMKSIHPDHYRVFLKHLKDPLLYEDFITIVNNRNMSSELASSLPTSRWREIADSLYSEYRKLPRVKIRGFIMHSMVAFVYLPSDDLFGMDKVAEDYYGRFNHLGFWLSLRFMDLFARRGDVQSLTRVRETWLKEFADWHFPPPEWNQPLMTWPDLLPRLQVHAVRGELNEVRRIFTEAQAYLGPKLCVQAWNILLNAHAKAGEYEAALRVFDVLKESLTPDSWSYGTIMGMTGSMGDIEFTLELYHMAIKDGIVPSATMIDCVIQAYCMNDRLTEAESIANGVMSQGEEAKWRLKKKDLATLWNTLIFHHAERRDLINVNRTLTIMMDNDIPFDAETYANLLHALALCKQPHHALALIQESVKRRSWKPSMKHYALLMSAFLRTHQPKELLRTSSLLRSLGLPPTGETLLNVLRALAAWTVRPPSHQKSENPRKYLISALRQFRLAIEWDHKPHKVLLAKRARHRPWIDFAPEPQTVANRTAQANTLIVVFAQLREVATVQEILGLWKSSSPETSAMEEPPITLLEAIMQSCLYEGKYDEVAQIWEMIFERVVRLGCVTASGTKRKTPLSAMRYRLNNALATMQRVFAAKEDANGLREVVLRVMRAGFLLDSRNWNKYVQLLASLNLWREAFVTCEERLLPQWYGWSHVRRKESQLRDGSVPKNIPLEIRRLAMRKSYRRPTTYTFMILAKSFMELEKMACWSGEAERLFNYVKAKAPGTVEAIQNMFTTGSAVERQIFIGNRKEAEEANQVQQQGMRPRKHPGIRVDPQQGDDNFLENMLRPAHNEGPLQHNSNWDMADVTARAALNSSLHATSAAHPTHTPDDNGLQQPENADIESAHRFAVDEVPGEWHPEDEQDGDDWTPLRAEKESDEKRISDHLLRLQQKETTLSATGNQYSKKKKWQPYKNPQRDKEIPPHRQQEGESEKV